MDRFLFLGDYLFDLPFSEEVLEILRRCDGAEVILGNKEHYLDWLSREDPSTWWSEQLGILYQTCRELSGGALAYLGTLPDECRVPLESGRFLYAVHYPPALLPQLKRDCGSCGFLERMLAAPFTHEQFLRDFERLLQRDDYRQYFAGTGARAVLFGHNHLQCHGSCAGTLVINPGSCGSPLDFDSRAAYTILKETDTGLRVEERRVAYDVEAVIGAAKRTACYRAGRVWMELVFITLRTGRDYTGRLFRIAARIARDKGETGRLFANGTWNEAYERLAESL